jgi:hypothetical protein
MAFGGLNRDGPAGTLADMQRAARPAPDNDDSLPVRVARHDRVRADHGVTLDAYACLLGDHDARIAALEGYGQDGGADHATVGRHRAQSARPANGHRSFAHPRIIDKPAPDPHPIFAVRQTGGPGRTHNRAPATAGRAFRAAPDGAWA